MKFIPGRDLRIRPGEVWKKLSEGDLVITSNGRPVALMTRTSADTFDQDLEVLWPTKALTALDRIQRESVRTGRDKITDAEIDAIIQKVRKARRK